jgi:hypothetical protein
MDVYRTKWHYNPDDCTIEDYVLVSQPDIYCVGTEKYLNLLQFGEFYNLKSSQNIIRISKSRRMRWT